MLDSDGDVIVNDLDADITIISSDGVVFKIFRKYLDAGTAGFPSFEAVVVDRQPISL